MIGTDFGTTQSKCAYVDVTGRPVSILNARGEFHTPTVVLYGDSGNVLVGTEANEQSFLDPDRCARNFKLLLGTTHNLLKGAQTVIATDAAAEVFKALKADAERQLGIQVKEAVCTCPANSLDGFKAALREAAERSGIKVLKLVPEPTAAGLAYACDRAGQDMIFVVYDFGGGTFDVSILKAEGQQITVLATEGVHQLGGNDLNACLRRRVAESFKAKFGVDVAALNDPLLNLDIEQRIEAAKISLNKRPEVPVVIGYKGDSLVVKLTRAQFHADIKPLIDQSIEALDKAIKGAGLSNGQLDRLIMVGGTSKLQAVQEAVASHTGLVPRTDIDPQKAVSYGAALASIMELSSQGRAAALGGQVIPCPEVFVRDVTAHAVGCCVVDISGAKRRLINSSIIAKNTPIPCKKRDWFYLERDDQTEAHIEILQGEPEAERDNCLLVGEITLDNLPVETIKTKRIQVEYAIDANGMVTATVTDAVSGQQKTVSVDYRKGIKPRSKPNAA